MIEMKGKIVIQKISFRFMGYGRSVIVVKSRN